MANICTIKCPLGDHWMASVITKRGAPFVYCGLHKFGIMLLSKEAKNGFSNVCEEISDSELPPATKEWYDKKTAVDE